MSKKNKTNFKPKKEGSIKGNPKGKKPEFKGKDYNDFSWYDKNHQLVVDTANIPFNQPMSSVIDSLGTGYGAGLPLLMSLAHDWLVSTSDILTLAARQIWADVRKVNSGATNYEGSDILSIIMAAADVFINIKWMSAFFGIVSYFNARNKEVPQLLFASAGIDYDDFLQNLADYRARFNTLLLRARTLTIPKKYPWIEAAMALYGNLFKDEDTDTGREQLYIVHKAAFYILDASQSSSHGYSVRPITIRDFVPDTSVKIGIKGTNSLYSQVGDGVITGCASGKYTTRNLAKFSLFLDILAKQIEAIITNEDANVIQGDLMKAFGDSSAYTTGQIDASYEIKPIYSEEFGWYLHNSTVYNNTINEAGIDFQTSEGTADYFGNVCGYNNAAGTQYVGYRKIITQNPGNNSFNIVLDHTNMKGTLESGEFNNWKPILDTNKYSPTPEDVIWNTRGLIVYDGNRSVIPNGFFVGGVVWRIAKIQGTIQTKWNSFNLVSVLTKANQLDSRSYAALMPFAWKPIIYQSVPMGSVNYIEIVGDLNNVTTVDTETLARINDIVMLSLFDIPQR